MCRFRFRWVALPHTYLNIYEFVFFLTQRRANAFKPYLHQLEQWD